ncbi:unnamed protein product [Peronospora belbahrii]|uniref:Protein OS-9 homolog n=1 Tax=Peronospora belbahrii TaxID=622444 RepID=A0AAU9L9P1_9STRA|nr:unnamed protein product [Peronospora belbahrii]
MPRNVFVVLGLFYMAFVAVKAIVEQHNGDVARNVDEHDIDIEWESDDVIVRCRSCGAPVAYKSDFIDLHDTSKAVESRHEPILGDNVQLYTFVDHNREEFELAGFTEVLGLERSGFSKKATMFDDYSWRDISCSECKKPIGRVFYHEKVEECINTQLMESITTNRASEKSLPSTTKVASKAEIVRKELEGQCLTTVISWWTYEVCYGQEVRQYHEESDGSRSGEWSMGVFVPERRKTDADADATGVVQRFAGGQHCDENGKLRSTIVVYTCCQSRPNEVMIEKVGEPSLCKYLIRVCVPSLCDTEPDEEHDSDENEWTIESCKEQFEATHDHAKLPSTFTTLRWSSVILEDSSELDWSRWMQFASHG